MGENLIRLHIVFRTGDVLKRDREENLLPLLRTVSGNEGKEVTRRIPKVQKEIVSSLSYEEGKDVQENV